MKILYEVSTNTDVSPLLDAIACVITIFIPITNAIVLIAFDAKIQRNVYGLFGISVRLKNKPVAMTTSKSFKLAEQLQNLRLSF